MAGNGEELTVRRAKELAARAERTGLTFHTEFLTIYEQSAIRTLRFAVPCSFFGGCRDAERVIAVFGDAPDANEAIACIRISPKQQKFADELTHRDFLGALMNLGIRRETLGDILIRENVGYLFCLSEVAPFIVASLDRVRRTSVVCERTDAPDTASEEVAPVSVVIASERVDALLSAAFHLSREDSKAAVSDGRLFINGKQTFQAAAALHEGDILSLRGVGRVEFLGFERETKRGKLRVNVKIYR